MKRLWLLVCLPLLLSSCHVVRFFTMNFADIGDHKRFAKKDIPKGPTYFSFVETTQNKVKLPEQLSYKGNQYNFETFLEQSGTVAFLIIRNDTILMERYPDGGSRDLIVPSFSIAKSFVSALMGIAIHEGYVGSIDDPITKYLPDLNKQEFGAITIRHLLDMRSGIRFNEGYFNPFGDIAKYYYGTNINKYIKKLKIEGPPDDTFAYRSVNTQLLGMIISKATGKPLAEYMQEKIWSKLDMEYDASWSVDSRKHQTEKAFCCVNATARDFAKLGRLYLHEGNWNGNQIVPKEWVRQSVMGDQPQNDFRYSFQWWHNRHFYIPDDSAKITGVYKPIQITTKTGNTYSMLVAPTGDFYARGILGQFVYVLPEKNIVIVRLGKTRKHVDWDQLLREIALMN